MIMLKMAIPKLDVIISKQMQSFVDFSQRLLFREVSLQDFLSRQHLVKIQGSIIIYIRFTESRAIIKLFILEQLILEAEHIIVEQPST